MSDAHTYHPDTLTHGLSDDCPRCAQHADHPEVSLDAEHLGALWTRMLEVEYGPGGMYRSHAEARACRQLLSHARFLQTIGIHPRWVRPGTPYSGHLPGVDV